MNKFPMVLIALMLSGASGCGPIALKQGSGAADLQRDEAECRAQQPTDDGASKCLRDKGWTITQFGAPAAPVSPTASGSSNSSPSSATTAASDSNTATAADAVPSTPASADANGKIMVQSWWKAGAQAADFNSDANRCVAQLGAEHAPDYAGRLYSNSLVNCLREHGWRAGYNPVYTAPR